MQDKAETSEQVERETVSSETGASYGMAKYKKMSKPLMEKKRHERINTCLEQLKGLLEKHYSYNAMKRKLEKADILELTVKHIHYLLSVRQQDAHVGQKEASEYKAGFRGCLDKLDEYLQKMNSTEEKLGLRFFNHINAIGSFTPVFPRKVLMDTHILEMGMMTENPTRYTINKNNNPRLGLDYAIKRKKLTLLSGKNKRESRCKNMRKTKSLGTIDNKSYTTSLESHVKQYAPSSSPNECLPNAFQQPVQACWRPW